MTDNVIYFPNIRVPDTAWFTRVLLYWDKVGSIVPAEFIEKPEDLGPYMRSLVEEQLVTQVIPSEHRRMFSNRFPEKFLEMLKGNESMKQRMGAPFDDSSAVLIHADKFGFGFKLSGELCDLGLAKRDDPWYRVEPTTAHLYMAYLATVLGRSEDLLMQPITDTAESLAVFGATAAGASLDAQRKLRMIVLEELLPAPSLEVSAAELAKFKDEHWLQLKRFREEVDEELSHIARQPDDDFRSEMFRYTRKRWSREVEDITSLMRRRGWPDITLGTLCIVASATTAGLMSGDIPGAATGFFGAVISAVGKRPLDTGRMPEPMAYAALAQARLR